MLLFEANLVLRRSCRELYVMNGRRRTKIKWRNFGTDLSVLSPVAVWPGGAGGQLPPSGPENRGVKI